MNALSPSKKRLDLGLLALQLFRNAGLLLAAALWLEIPDSHLWELLLSLLSGAAIVAATLWLHATVMRRLRAALDGCALWLGAALLAVWAVVLYLPSIFADRWSPASYERASYWNSQLSPRLRTVFTYERLMHWQFAGFDFVVWFLVPALLLPFVLETVARGVGSSSWRNGIRVLCHWEYWASCIAVSLVLRFAISPLVDWNPAHSVAGELISVVIRLGVVYVAVVLLVTSLLGITAVLLARRNPAGETTPQPLEDRTQPALLDE